MEIWREILTRMKERGLRVDSRFGNAGEAGDERESDKNFFRVHIELDYMCI